MQSFLETLSDHICKHYADKLDKICIVLPNRRAGLFLKEHLAKKLKKVVWSPAIYSAEDFIVEVSGYRLMDSLDMLFLLYEAHRGIEKEPQPFSEFIKWAPTLLHDFNEIDLYLADPIKLYSYLSDAKAMTLWNLDQKPLTSFQQDYLRFYKSLGSYYGFIQQKLKEKKSFYQGALFRLVAETIQEKIPALPWDKVIFAGLNALTKAEEMIIKVLIQQEKAEIIWDADQYYVNNKEQEAGLFIRKYLKDSYLGKNKVSGDHLLTSPKSITVIGVPQDVGQAKAVGELLTDLSKSKKLGHDTALVLSDEKLFLPVLNSLPDSISEFNFTMGLSLAYTPLYDFIEALFALHKNNLQEVFYYKDLLRLLRQTYMQRIARSVDGGERLLDSIIERILSINVVFYSQQKIKTLIEDYSKELYIKLDCFIKAWGTSFSCTENILACLNQLKEVVKNTNTTGIKNEHVQIELEYVYAFTKIVVRLKELIKEYVVEDDIAVVQRIFNQLIRKFTLTFSGEPLKGLQVMGVLETRALDFENIIVLSLNENVFPVSKSYQSFILYDVRKSHGLPTYYDQDAIYAYHFYHLIQRAKNVFLLYNTEVNEFGKGEKSRFISQLLYELPKFNPQCKITELLLETPISLSKTISTIEIPKDESVYKRLLEKAQHGYSPTALNAYRKCSLQFYFKDILHLSETTEVEETIDAETLGKVVHEVAYQLYVPLVNQVLTLENIKEREKQIYLLIEQAFKKQYINGDIQFGKNKLIARVASMFIEGLVRLDKKELSSKFKSVCVSDLEKEFESFIEINVSDTLMKVRLHGIIDRIDRVNGDCRIIDYKTGFVADKELKVKNFEDIKTDPDLDKAFQLMMYKYLYARQDEEKEQVVVPGIISFRRMSKGFMQVNIEQENNESILEEFENRLKEMLLEIYDQKIPFKQTSNTKVCEKCKYNAICNKN